MRVTPRRLRSSKKVGNLGLQLGKPLRNRKREREAYICDNLCRPAVCFHRAAGVNNALCVPHVAAMVSWTLRRALCTAAPLPTATWALYWASSDSTTTMMTKQAITLARAELSEIHFPKSPLQRSTMCDDPSFRKKKKGSHESSDHGGSLFALRSHVMMEPREERRIEAEG